MSREFNGASSDSGVSINAQVQTYRTYTHRVHMLVYLGGILHRTTHSCVWTYCTSIVVIVVCIGHAFLVLNALRDNLGSLTKIVACLGIANGALGPAITAICFMIKRNKLMQLHKMLDDLFEEEFTQHEDTRAALFSALHTFDRPAYILIFMIISTNLAFFFPPLSSIILQTIHDTQPRKYKFAYPLKYPWHTPENGFLYYVHMSFQGVVAWCLMCSYGGGDAQFSLYAFQISAILQSMSYKLTNLSLKEDYLYNLKICMKKHQQLLECISILEEIYGFIIIRMITTNAVIMCALISEAAQHAHMTTRDIIVNTFYMLVKLTQTFIYAWYGSFITSASENFREAIYMSKWTGSTLDQKLKTNIIMIMMQKPMFITAMKICSVNVNMFTNILNTTISYFFLLQTMDKVGE